MVKKKLVFNKTVKRLHQHQMKVAFILPALSNHGPVIVARDIIHYLYSKGVHVDVYYFDDIKELTFDAKADRISIYGKINFSNYDIIHSHMLRPDLYVWKNKKSIPCITISTLHQDIEQNLTYSYNRFIAKLFTKLWLMVLKKHDAVVFLSDSMKNQYKNSLIKQQHPVIHNGRTINYKTAVQNKADMETIKNFKKERKIIGVVARLTKRKGVDQLVKALALLPDYALLIVGDGKERSNLEKLAYKLNIKDQVLFLGYRDNGFLYLKYVDIFGLPSISEGLSLGFLEAANAKLPIVCSDLPVFRELFDDHHISFFKLQDIQSLKHAILNAYSKKSLLGTNIYNKVTLAFSGEVMGENYYKLYDTMIRQYANV